MHIENSLEATLKSTEKKAYSQPKLTEFGNVNVITESLHSLAATGVVIGTPSTVTLIL